MGNTFLKVVIPIPVVVLVFHSLLERDRTGPGPGSWVWARPPYVHVGLYDVGTDRAWWVQGYYGMQGIGPVLSQLHKEKGIVGREECVCVHMRER